MMLSAPSRSQDAVVKSTLDPANGAVVGQAVSLYVDVLFPNAMPRPPRVRRISDTPGTQIMRSREPGRDDPGKYRGRELCRPAFHVRGVSPSRRSFHDSRSRGRVARYGGQPFRSGQGQPRCHGRRRSPGHRCLQTCHRLDPGERQPGLVTRSRNAIRRGRRDLTDDHTRSHGCAVPGDERFHLHRAGRRAGLCRSACRRRPREPRLVERPSG